MKKQRDLTPGGPSDTTEKSHVAADADDDTSGDFAGNATIPDDQIDPGRGGTGVISPTNKSSDADKRPLSS